LSVHPGPDVSARAAVSLAGVAPGQIGALLTELTRANLLTEHANGRYAFHDLLRAYAASLFDEVDPPADRRAATHRMLDHYLHTAHAADLVLHPHFSEISLPPPSAGVTPERPLARSDATAWFTAEAAVLLAVVPLAAQSGFEGHAWRLAWTMEGFLSRHGHWPDWLCTERVGLAAAARIGDEAGQGHVLRGLGLVCSRLGRHDEADEHLRRALDLFLACGDDTGQAHTQLNLGQVTERRGRHREALDHSRRALVLFRRGGCRAGHAYTLNAVGWGEALLGNHHRALELCAEALRLLQEVDDVQGQADTWDSLGYADHHLGNHRRAIACFENALGLFKQVADRYAEASTYANIGGSYRAVGELVATHAAWYRALVILDELGHVDAERIRAQLDQLECAIDSESWSTNKLNDSAEFATVGI
jgi:tetratricopeptide (TPR) repeat protein